VTNGVPFSAFNFKVEIALPDEPEHLCKAAFSECSGLEVTADVKTIREGGNNTRPLHLVGPVSYAQLGLKRGMTEGFDLWRWFDRVLVRGEGHLRATCEVAMLSSDRTTTNAVFVLTGCLPTKIKAPSLNAKDGAVAIEELQIAYELLTLKPAAAGGGARA
jgi:phage tail-like protein